MSIRLLAAVVFLLLLPAQVSFAQGTLEIYPQIPSQFLWNNGGTPTIRLGEPFYIDLYWDYINDSSMLGGSVTIEFLSPDFATITKNPVSGALPFPYENVVLKNGFQDQTYWNFFGSPSDWPSAFYIDNFDQTLPDIFGHAFGATGGLPGNLGPTPFYEFHFTISDSGTFCVDTILYLNEAFGWYFGDANSQDISAPQDDFPYCFPVAFQPSTDVTNMNDVGYGSLQYAITSANYTPGIDTIRFGLSGIISLITPLPELLDDSTVIIGSSAPGGARSVIIDGSALSSGDGIIIAGSNCRIQDLVIRNFPGNGITIFGSPANKNLISGNLIYENGGLAIDLNNDGVTSNDNGDSDTGPNEMLNFPVVDSVIMNPDSSFTVYGNASPGNTVQIYVAHPDGDNDRPADPSGHGEAYNYVGSDTCDPGGVIEYIVPKTYPQFTVLTFLATDLQQNSSELSENVNLVPSPLIIVAYSPVNLKITDPNGSYIGRDPFGNLLQTLFPATYDDVGNDSVNIPRPVAGVYQIEVVAENDTPPGSTYSIGVRIDGSVQSTLVWNADVPTSGAPPDSIDYTVEEEWHYLNGDASGNGTINILDITYIIGFLYKGGAAPYPLASADAQCNGIVNILDATFIIQYLYKGGIAPCQL